MDGNDIERIDTKDHSSPCKGAPPRGFPISFFAEHTLDPRTFDIEIEGVGPVSMPLGRHEIERLLGVSSAAKFGLRAKSDWSIEGQPSCKCAYCRTAIDFLESATEPQKIWPIAQQHRDHIMNVFGGSGLPIRFDVRKEGSPHKLVITKSERLYVEEKKRFERLKSLGERLRFTARSASI